MDRVIEWDGQPFALLVDGPTGRYLVPSIVRDRHGDVIRGHEVLETVVEVAHTTHLPVVSNAEPSDVGEINQRMQQLSAQLGVPIGPPDDHG